MHGGFASTKGSRRGPHVVPFLSDLTSVGLRKRQASKHLGGQTTVLASFATTKMTNEGKRQEAKERIPHS